MQSASVFDFALTNSAGCRSCFLLRLDNSNVSNTNRCGTRPSVHLVLFRKSVVAFFRWSRSTDLRGVIHYTTPQLFSRP